MKQGFTLVEFMVASAILVIISVSFASAAIGSARLIKTAYSEAECSVRMREVRERLLFHAAPSPATVCWTGLISATNASGGRIVESSGVLYSFAGALMRPTGEMIDPDPDVTGQDLRIIAAGNQTRYLMNDRNRTSEQWFRPGNIQFLKLTSGVDVFEGNDREDGWYYVNLRCTGDRGYSRGERIVIPVFGRRQVSYGASGTYNDRGEL